MFVVVSQRPEFCRRCAEALSRWGTVREVGSLAQVPLATRSKPAALVVADAQLSSSLTSALIQDWVKRCEGSRLVVADTAFSPLDELAALAAGAVACCDTHLPQEEFERIVEVVLHGGVWVSKSAIPLLMAKLQALATPAVAPAPPHDGLDGLTERQREVAQMVGRGASNKQIARALDISDRTVKAHLTSIFEKLGVSDRLQLALHVNGSRGDAHPQA